MKQSRFLKRISLLLIFCLSISLLVISPVKAQSLSASPSKIEIGPDKIITVSFSGAPEEDNHSIDLYRAGETTILASQNLNGKTSGTLEFTAPQRQGSYEFQLWKNDKVDFPVRKLATSNAVSIDWGTSSLSHTIGTHHIGPDKKIKVSFANRPGYSSDNIGLWKVGGSGSLSRHYLGDYKSDGTVEFSAPEYPGTYEFQMWTKNGVVLIESLPLTVEWMPVKMDVSIGLPKSNGKRELSIEYSGAPGYRRDYIGLWKVGYPKRIAFKYLGGKTSGTIKLTCPTDTDSYEVQLWASHSIDAIAKTQAFIPNNCFPPPVDQNIDNTSGDSKITILLTVGSKYAEVNGKSFVLDVAPQILKGRTVIPLRFVTEALGCEVEWDGKKQQIKIKLE